MRDFDPTAGWVGFKPAGCAHADRFGPDGALILAIETRANESLDRAGWAVHADGKARAALTRLAVDTSGSALALDAIHDLLSSACHKAEVARGSPPAALVTGARATAGAAGALPDRPACRSRGIERTMFARLFRSHFGLPPSMYRAKQMATKATRTLLSGRRQCRRRGVRGRICRSCSLHEDFAALHRLDPAAVTRGPDLSHIDTSQGWIGALNRHAWSANRSQQFFVPPSSSRSARKLRTTKVAGFERRFSAYLDQVRKDQNAPPGFVVVVVQGDRTIFAKAYGVRDVRTKAPLTLHNRMYTGSTTKAYTGLLAAELDRRGLVPLSTSLEDLWPTLILPGSIDPASVTAAKFLSHSAPIQDPGLTFISNATGEWTVDMVPAHLAKFGRPMNKPFQYSNFGPFMYSVMVRKKLGLPYNEALQRYVLRPLGLHETSARLEDFRADEIGRCNTLIGFRQRVAERPTKADADSECGGRGVHQRHDAAAFLKAFTSEGRSEAQRFPSPRCNERLNPLPIRMRTPGVSIVTNMAWAGTFRLTTACHYGCAPGSIAAAARCSSSSPRKSSGSGC